jgi:hypothetical protein
MWVGFNYVLAVTVILIFICLLLLFCYWIKTSATVGLVKMYVCWFIWNSKVHWFDEFAIKKFLSIFYLHSFVSFGIRFQEILLIMYFFLAYISVFLSKHTLILCPVCVFIWMCKLDKYYSKCWTFMNYSLLVLYIVNILTFGAWFEQLNQLGAMMEVALSGILKPGALLKSFEMMNVLLP